MTCITTAQCDTFLDISQNTVQNSKIVCIDTAQCDTFLDTSQKDSKGFISISKGCFLECHFHNHKSFTSLKGHYVGKKVF